MKIHRFFVEEIALKDKVILTAPELVNQIGRVLRVRRGEVITLTHGDGTDVRYEVQKINEDEIQLSLKERVKVWVPEKKITIYLAPIRKEYFEWALEKCTEIGASCFVPLLTERSERGVVKRERAEAVIKEATEQCGRGDVPRYEEPVELKNLPEGEYLALNMGGVPFEKIQQVAGEIKILIGPEGGWTDLECAFFTSRGIPTVSLGPTTLRAETAAVVASAKMI